MRRALLLAIGAPLVLVLGFKLVYVTSYPTYMWHQKLTVELQAGDHVISASSVSEVQVRILPKILPDVHDREIKLRGEAVVLDILGRGKLFALLDGMQGIAQQVFWDYLLPHGTPSEQFSILACLRKSRDVPPKYYPLMVAFADISDPKTVRKVDPADIAATFGSGVSLLRITLEITEGEVTEGKITKVLHWLPTVGNGMLDGNEISSLSNKNGLANEISRLNFRKTRDDNLEGFVSRNSFHRCL